MAHPPTAAVLLAAAMLAACAGVPMPVWQNAPAIDARPLRAALQRTPPVQLQARAVLERAGAETDFALVVQVVPPDEVRAAGLTDLGGKVFEAVWRAGSVDARVESPLAPGLGDGTLAGLAAVLAPPDANRWRAVATAGADAALYTVYGDRELLAWCADGARVDRWVIGRDGRRRQRVTIEEWTGDEGAERPARLRIDDDRGWSLRLEIAEWRTREPR